MPTAADLTVDRLKKIIMPGGYFDELFESFDREIKKIEGNNSLRDSVATFIFLAEFINHTFDDFHLRFISNPLVKVSDEVQNWYHSAEYLDRWNELKRTRDKFYSKLYTALKPVSKEDVKKFTADYCSMNVAGFIADPKETAESRATLMEEIKKQNELNNKFQDEYSVKSKQGMEYIYGGVIAVPVSVILPKVYGTFRTRFEKQEDGSWKINCSVGGLIPNFITVPEILDKATFTKKMQDLGVSEALLTEFFELDKRDVSLDD